MTPAELRQTCDDALQLANVRAFLRVIRTGESSQDDDAYHTLVGGARFESLADHPNIYVARFNSTAAGAYQFLHRTWVECKEALTLPDFSPHSQDLAAVFLIRRRGALPSVLSGKLDAAIKLCNKEWASLPGSPYGQHTQTFAEAQATFARYGGLLEGQAVIPPESQMPPFLLAALPSLIEAAPALIRSFGDSPQAEKNAKAAEMVAEVAKKVTGQPTLEGAVNAIQTNPTQAAAYREEIHASLADINAAVMAAHEADEKSRDKATDRNIALSKVTGGRWMLLVGFIAVVIVLMTYVITIGVLFSKGSAFTSDLKSLLLGQVVILGFATVVTFIFGSSLSSKAQQAANIARPPQP